LQQYVDSLIGPGDKDSLDFAYAISFDHPAWMEKISALRAKVKPEISDKTHAFEVSKSFEPQMDRIEHGNAPRSRIPYN
jgi:hypothetical protein